MTNDALIDQIRRLALGQRDATTRRRLDELVNRPRVAQQLLRLVESGGLVDAQLAATALGHAKSELVRRALVRLAKSAEGERRLFVLASLTDDELARVREATPTPDEPTVSTLLALNDPRAMAELVSDRRRHIDAATVERIEALRLSFGLGPATLYAPLLARALTPDARARVLAILGRCPGDRVKQLLEHEEQRAGSGEAATTVRRERLRQASSAMDRAARDGVAFLGPPGPTDAAALEIFERREQDRALRTRVVLRFAGDVEPLTEPLTEAAIAIDQRAADPTWVELSLGQARALVGQQSSREAAALSSLVERLEDVPLAALPQPAPTELSTPADAHALAAEALTSNWHPFSGSLRWPKSLLAGSADVEPREFPRHLDHTSLAAREQVGSALAETKVAARLAAGFRLLALHLALRRDPRAGALAAESLLVARRRPGPFTLALAERELASQLVLHAALPRSYRDELRRRLRERLAVETPHWEDVRRLDLAAAAAEGLARSRFGHDGGGLPGAETIDLDVALHLADRAQSDLAVPSFRRRLKGATTDRLTEIARGWLEDAPPPAVVEVAQFASRTCVGDCPHRCFERPPSDDARAVWRAPPQ